MNQRIGLEITLPEGKTQDASYASDSVLIGSGPSAVLRLDYPGVSSIHAVIKVSPEGTVTIIDLGSEAGTSVNGAVVTEPLTLKNGDEIRVGRVSLVLRTGLVANLAEDKTLETDVGAKKAASALAAKQAEGAASRSRPDDREAPTLVGAPPPAPPAKQESKPESKAASKAASKAPDPLATQKIRERIPVKQAEAGSRIITADSDLDLGILEKPLEEANRPTAEQRVLEVVARFGDMVIDAIQVAEPREIVVGGRMAKKADLRVEGLPADQFTIAINSGSEAQIVIPADAKVAMRKSDGKVTRDVSLANTDAPFPARALRLGINERVAFKVGNITFVAQYVKGDARMGKGGGMDWYFPRVFVISALVHAFFVVAAFITPEGSGSLVDDLFKNQNRFAQMILKAQEKEKKQKKLDLSGMKGGAKHKGDEGKFGKKDKPKKDALASKAGAPRVDPNKREKDRKIALNAGLLGILKGAGQSGAVSNVFGPGGLGTGINNAMGGLRGTEMGDAGGAGGLGSRGTGAGGGGDSLGIGGLGTHGHGRGTGGYGNIDLGGRGKGTTRIVPGKTIIQGSLSKEEIGRVIRRNLARFKYCYEKQLNANPNLSGKISVYFTIAPTGDVAQASVRETSMNDENVESCAVKVMRSLKFPKPRGGGIVVVTYPFVFAAT
jgi:TonB family protein